MKKITIAYVTESSPNDKHAWSGTAHYVYKSLLEEGFTVHALGPARPGLVRILLAACNKLSLFIFRKRLDYRHSKLYAKAFGNLFTKKLRNLSYDLVVFCGTTEAGAYVKTQKPKMYVLDRTIGGALNYHTILSDLWDFSEKSSVYTDRKAMEEATLLFFSSPWAAGHAVKNYGIAESKIRILPFGANLDAVPDRVSALKSKSSTEWNLLLVGTYWDNKGADIAFNALLELLTKGVNASLTVVGCVPPEPIKHDRLHIIPFIDKNSKDGLSQMWDLFLSHHIFILPTRFDCTPIVFCEASSFGMPILTADTGGVAGHVQEGINGYLIPFQDKGKAYAEKILELDKDRTKFELLRRTSRDLYESRLNWKHWSAEFRREAEKLL